MKYVSWSRKWLCVSLGLLACLVYVVSCGKSSECIECAKEGESVSDLHYVVDRYYSLRLAVHPENKALLSFFVCDVSEPEVNLTGKCVFAFLNKDGQPVLLKAESMIAVFEQSKNVQEKRKNGTLTDTDKTSLDTLGMVSTKVSVEGQYQPSIIIALTGMLNGEPWGFFTGKEAAFWGLDTEKLQKAMQDRVRYSDVYVGSSEVEEQFKVLMEKEGKKPEAVEYSVDAWLDSSESTRFVFEDLFTDQPHQHLGLRLPLVMRMFVAMLYKYGAAPRGVVQHYCLPHPQFETEGENGWCIPINYRWNTGSVEKYQRVEELYQPSTKEDNKNPDTK